MVLFIGKQRLGKYFIGNLPKTHSQAHSRFLLSLGMSLSSLAPDSRGLRHKKRGIGLRELVQSPTTQKLFARRLGNKIHQADEAAYHLEVLLDDSKKPDTPRKWILLHRRHNVRYVCERLHSSANSAGANIGEIVKELQC
jgi:hypothetical protein